MTEIPLAPIGRLMKKAGAPRVSEEAIKVLVEKLESEIEKISKDASALAKHAGRKTVTGADIKLAFK
jgi:histone H3/H4